MHSRYTRPLVALGVAVGVAQADGGSELGTYLELGVGPSWAIADGKATVAIPIKLGLSLKPSSQKWSPRLRKPATRR